MIKEEQIVKVLWTDTVEENDISEFEAKKLTPSDIISIGKLLVSDEERVVIVSSWFVDDGNLRQVLSIPKAIVKTIEEVSK